LRSCSGCFSDTHGTSLLGYELGMKPAYDVVVVGSGFGGGTTACRLAQAGRSVCILERGKRWNKADFPRSPAEVGQAFWLSGRSYGFLEYKVFKRMDVIQGCGVGGGSLHYFNVHLRAPSGIFHPNVWPKEVTRILLDPYYAVAEEMLESKPLSPPAGRGLPLRTQAFLAATESLKRKAVLVPIGVYTGPDRLNPHSGVVQTACNYSGNCMLGCDLHAKNTVDITYIRLAEKNGTEVYPLHVVEKMEPLDEGYRVSFRRLDPADPGHSEAGSVIGRQVVLAAGTLGTTELLLRCRDEHRTLSRLGAGLGTRFSGNGDFLLAGTLDACRQVDPGIGPSITAGADFSTSANRIFIEDLGFPDAFMWLLEGMIPAERRLENTLRTFWMYLLNTLGIGEERVPVEVGRLFQGGVTSRLLPYLAMGTDASDGKLSLRNSSIYVEWSHRRSRKLFDEIEKSLAELSRGLNGRYETSVLWRWPLRKLLTAHPLGGCPMGDNQETSVVRHQGEVWGYPNLFIVDGSAIPSALSVNPSLTITCLAERVAFTMIHGRDLGPDDPERPMNH
jgi:cholesterol oxidase